jgi:hypothetical protein
MGLSGIGEWLGRAKVSFLGKSVLNQWYEGLEGRAGGKLRVEGGYLNPLCGLRCCMSLGF